jgi:hypothetical protein
MPPRQPDLFGYDLYSGEPPHQAHSTTSAAAARSIAPRIGDLHRRIIAWLRGHPQGATDEEMQDDLDMPANTQRPRRRELQLAGYVEDSGKTRLTRSGRNAVVWRLLSIE